MGPVPACAILAAVATAAILCTTTAAWQCIAGIFATLIAWTSAGPQQKEKCHERGTHEKGGKRHSAPKRTRWTTKVLFTIAMLANTLEASQATSNSQDTINIANGYNLLWSQRKRRALQQAATEDHVTEDDIDNKRDEHRKEDEGSERRFMFATANITALGPRTPEISRWTPQLI